MIHAVAFAPPRRRSPGVPPALAGSDAVRGKVTPEKVLIVDDNDDIRELYAEVLTDAGYSVVQACNGQEALDRVADAKPDLVVMDLSMPVLDGWEATKQIKADPETADVFIIAVTAHRTTFGLQGARDFGADNILSKPCLPDDLLRAIRQLLDDDD